MRVEKMQFEALEDIIIWGIKPMMQLCKHLDSYIERELNDDDGVLWYHYEIRNGLERLEEALYNFNGSCVSKSKKQKVMELMEGMSLNELDAICLYADACIENIRSKMLMEDAAADLATVEASQAAE